jgi:hypothetical protein
MKLQFLFIQYTHFIYKKYNSFPRTTKQILDQTNQTFSNISLKAKVQIYT